LIHDEFGLLVLDRNEEKMFQKFLIVVCRLIYKKYLLRRKGITPELQPAGAGKNYRYGVPLPLCKNPYYIQK